MFGNATVAFFISRFKNIDKGKVKRRTIFVMMVSSVLIFGCGAYRNLTPRLNLKPNHEYYGSQFNDVQSIQIVAAKRFGISPLKDRNEAESLIKEGQLKRIRSCNKYLLAPMRHSIPYLTNNAAELLNDIGKNFRDSLDAKGMVYANPHYLNNIIDSRITQNYPIWVANYKVTRPSFGKWQYWQFTDRALVKGVGCVDLNVKRK